LKDSRKGWLMTKRKRGNYFVYLVEGIAKHPRRNKQLPTLDRVYMCVYTANASVYTVYPSALKIGDFSTKDKTKTLQIKYVRCNGIRLLSSQRDKDI